MSQFLALTVAGIATYGCVYAMGVADSAAVMAAGRVEVQGSPDEVRDALGDIYLRAGRH